MSEFKKKSACITHMKWSKILSWHTRQLQESQAHALKPTIYSIGLKCVTGHSKSIFSCISFHIFATMFFALGIYETLMKKYFARFQIWISKIRTRNFKNLDFGGKVDFWPFFVIYLIQRHEIATTVSICQLVHLIVPFMNRLSQVQTKYRIFVAKNTPPQTYTHITKQRLEAYLMMRLTWLSDFERYTIVSFHESGLIHVHIAKKMSRTKWTITMFLAMPKGRKQWRGRFSPGRRRKNVTSRGPCNSVYGEKRFQDLIQTNPEGIWAHRQS